MNKLISEYIKESQEYKEMEKKRNDFLAKDVKLWGMCFEDQAFMNRLNFFSVLYAIPFLIMLLIGLEAKEICHFEPIILFVLIHSFYLGTNLFNSKKSKCLFFILLSSIFIILGIINANALIAFGSIMTMGFFVSSILAFILVLLGIFLPILFALLDDDFKSKDSNLNLKSLKLMLFSQKRYSKEKIKERKKIIDDLLYEMLAKSHDLSGRREEIAKNKEAFFEILDLEPNKDKILDYDKIIQFYKAEQLKISNNELKNFILIKNEEECQIENT